MVSLSGVLGSGKTVVVKGIASGFGISEDELASPSYTIIQEYGSAPTLFHIDLYRLSSHEELEYLGLGEILESGGVCLIEWGEKASDYLPSATIYVTISILPDDKRLIELKGTGL